MKIVNPEEKAMKRMVVQMLIDDKSVEEVIEKTGYSSDLAWKMYWALTRCRDLVDEMQDMRDDGYTLRDIESVLDVSFHDAQVLTISYTSNERNARLKARREKENLEKKERRQRLIQKMHREEPKGGSLPDFLKGVGKVDIQGNANKRIAGVPDITMETRKEKQCHSNQYFIRKNGIYGGV